MNRKGDTIVEVLLAMTVLSAILFTSWGLTNKATQINLAARTRIEMVNQLKEQAEIIKSRHKNKESTSPSNGGGPVSTITSQNPCDDVSFTNPSQRPALSYAFNKTDTIAPTSGVKQVNGDTTKLVWVQYTTDSGYKDYYIRACWQTAGVQSTDNSQIIMRLNND